jgi:drug/metabolite transporter (DMT)-like permease
MLERPSAAKEQDSFGATARPGIVNGPRIPRRGLLLMFLGLALFSVLNGVVKAQAEFFPINQIVFFRNAGGALPLLAILFWFGEQRRFTLRHAPLHLLQAAIMTSGILLTFTAFHLMPLANVMAIGFTQPIIVTVASIVFLGERIGRPGWAALVLGLIGVQLMIAPSSAGMNIGALAAACGTVCSATAMMLQRRLTVRESPLLITTWYMVLSSLALLPSLGVFWVTPTGTQLAGLVAMGLASGLLQLVMVQALYHATAATVAPVSYTNMLWAVLIGYVWFGDVPTVFVLAGSVVVIAATALLVRSAHRSENCTEKQRELPGGCR